jgi:hypothetical protein
MRSRLYPAHGTSGDNVLLAPPFIVDAVTVDAIDAIDAATARMREDTSPYTEQA